jgi:hypothetical protein
MKDKIFIINQNKLTELNETEFGDEDQFQQLLEDYPNLISGTQINPENPRKWILIDREAGIPSEQNGSNVWSIDHLFLDQDGIPTLVEVKRSTDTRIRREVVGQMLDYAANAVAYWSIEEIQNKFEKYCSDKDVDSETEIMEFADNVDNINEFWDRVDTNLKAGKIRLLFVADKLPKELIRIIEFLNNQMSPAEVLGLELRHFTSDKIKTLVPRIVGKTASAEVKKGIRQNRHWDKTSFIKELLANNHPDTQQIVEYILDNLKDNVSRYWYGTGKVTGSIVPILDTDTGYHQLFAIYSYGKIEIYFQYYVNKIPFNDLSKRMELLNKLNGIGLNIPESKIDKRPGFEIMQLADQTRLDGFIEIFKWFVNEIHKSQD